MDGTVVLEQPAPGEGYRFNVDAPLLARFAVADQKPIDHLIDLGAGVGAVALCAARMAPVHRATLVEVDPEVCAIARTNVERAALTERVSVVTSDVADVRVADVGLADLIVVNPPYAEPGAGRPSPVRGRDRARRGSLEPFVRACAELLDTAGRACFCHPVTTFVGLLTAARASGLHARRAQFVFPAQGRPARIVLVELRRQDGDMLLE